MTGEISKKPFYLSKTFAGVLIMILGFYSPKIASQLTTNLDDVLAVAGYVAPGIGALLAIIGRLKANTSLTIKKEKE